MGGGLWMKLMWRKKARERALKIFIKLIWLILFIEFHLIYDLWTLCNFVIYVIYVTKYVNYVIYVIYGGKILDRSHHRRTRDEKSPFHRDRGLPPIKQQIRDPTSCKCYQTGPPNAVLYGSKFSHIVQVFILMLIP